MFNFVSVKEKCRLRVFENRVLRNIFGALKERDNRQVKNTT
jgi:hypothetical protein